MPRPDASPKKLLILFDVSFPFVKGGAQRRFYEVGRVLARRGWSVDWLTFQAWDGPSEIEYEGIRYIGLGSLPELYTDDGARTSSEPVLFAKAVLKNLPRLRRYDAVWVGQWPLLHVAPVLLYTFLLDRRVVLDWWEVWGYDLWTRYRRLPGYVGYWLERLILSVLAPRHITVTDSHLEEGRIRALAGPSAPIHRISNGIPVEDIGEVEDHPSYQADLVCLGRLKDHKRVDVLLEALAILKEDYGEQPSVDIIGDGPERLRLESMARERSLTAVRFHGFIEDQSEVYRRAKQARVCVVTTQSGGGGNLSLLEAYGCGLPVVAFRVEEGIDPDLIDEGETGLLVSPPTAQALADAIRGLLADPQGLERMREGARQKAKGLGWDVIAAEYEAVFVESAS